MFDRLEDLVIRYQEVMGELQEPDVANDPERFRKLMKEQSDLAPIVEAYQEYKNCKQNVEESLMILEEESDEEMRELAKEELNESKARIEELEQELKILLLPKDPNDDKNVIVEIRAGAGGDEAALSVSGTRCTRCTPLSYFIREYAPCPVIMNTHSLNPPIPFSFREIISVFHLRLSAKCRRESDDPGRRIR